MPEINDGENFQTIVNWCAINYGSFTIKRMRNNRWRVTVNWHHRFTETVFDGWSTSLSQIVAVAASKLRPKEGVKVHANDDRG